MRSLRERVLDAAVPFGFGVVYVITAARTILGGDNGELVTLGVTGNVAHPPGYPLYTLLLRGFAWLPAQSPVHRAAVITAVLAALSLAALRFAATRWGASRLSASVATALYGASPLAWSLATHAEVFALSVLLAMLMVGVASPSAPPPRGSETLRSALLGLLAGLGLANHQTIAFLAPIGLTAVGYAIRRADRRLATAGVALASFAVGLSPYAILLVRARTLGHDDPCTWGDPFDLAALRDHVLRVDYGTFQLSAAEAKSEALPHLGLLLERVFVDLSGAPLAILLGGLVVLRDPKARTLRGRLPLIALVGSFLLVGPIFISRFNIPPRDLALLIAARFHLLPLALVALFVALSLDACLEAAASRARAGRVLLVAASVVILGRGALSFASIREEHRPTVELYARNVLLTLPPNAILLASGDDLVGGMLYFQCALGERKDVTTIVPSLLTTDWHSRRIEKALGITIARHEDEAKRRSVATRPLVASLLGTGRPVFLSDWFGRDLDRAVPSYPLGPLVRLVGTPAELPPPMALLTENEALYGRLVVGAPPVLGTWAGYRYRLYGRPFAVLAPALDAGGYPAEAESARRRAKAFEPLPP